MAPDGYEMICNGMSPYESMKLCQHDATRGIGRELEAITV